MPAARASTTTAASCAAYPPGSTPLATSAAVTLAHAATVTQPR